MNEKNANNELNNNQHYITESFVKKRFGNDGFVHRYDVQHNSWKNNASPQFIFSGAGYTQFLEEGQPVDNTLEISFSNLENKLQFILPALDEAAEKKTVTISEDLYKDFCFYCAYLWYLSPFAKAKAPANFVIELDLALKHGNLNYLRELQIAEDEIHKMQEQYSAGYQFILKGENYLQYAFRGEFIRHCKDQAAIFRYKTKWTVYNSPIELPISDIALIDYPESKKAQLFILPISPNRVLIGRLELGSPAPYHTTDTVIYGNVLTTESAEDVLDIICLSAIKAIVCKNKLDIRAIRERAKSKSIAFTKIKNLDDVLTAGTKVFDRKKEFRPIPVSKEEYVRYVHSFIGPAET